MSIYEILPALDLTQSVHAKISIRMHRGGQILNFQNTFDRPWNEIRKKIHNRQKISLESSSQQD